MVWLGVVFSKARRSYYFFIISTNFCPLAGVQSSFVFSQGYEVRRIYRLSNVYLSYIYRVSIVYLSCLLATKGLRMGILSR